MKLAELHTEGATSDNPEDSKQVELDCIEHRLDVGNWHYRLSVLRDLSQELSVLEFLVLELVFDFRNL